MFHFESLNFCLLKNFIEFEEYLIFLKDIYRLFQMIVFQENFSKVCARIRISHRFLTDFSQIWNGFEMDQKWIWNGSDFFPFSFWISAKTKFTDLQILVWKIFSSKNFLWASTWKGPKSEAKNSDLLFLAISTKTIYRIFICYVVGAHLKIFVCARTLSPLKN